MTENIDHRMCVVQLYNGRRIMKQCSYGHYNKPLVEARGAAPNYMVFKIYHQGSDFANSGWRQDQESGDWYCPEHSGHLIDKTGVDNVSEKSQRKP